MSHEKRRGQRDELILQPPKKSRAERHAAATKTIDSLISSDEEEGGSDTQLKKREHRKVKKGSKKKKKNNLEVGAVEDEAAADALLKLAEPAVESEAENKTAPSKAADVGSKFVIVYFLPRSDTPAYPSSTAPSVSFLLPSEATLQSSADDISFEDKKSVPDLGNAAIQTALINGRLRTFFEVGQGMFAFT